MVDDLNSIYYVDQKCDDNEQSLPKVEGEDLSICFNANETNVLSAAFSGGNWGVSHHQDLFLSFETF